MVLFIFLTIHSLHLADLPLLQPILVVRDTKNSSKSIDFNLLIPIVATTVPSVLVQKSIATVSAVSSIFSASIGSRVCERKGRK